VFKIIDKKTLKEIYNKYKENLFLSLMNSIDLNYKGDIMEKIIDKLFSRALDFSINNFTIHLPELMGWSIFLGMKLQQRYTDMEKAKEELRQRLEKEKDYQRGYV
jgi:hypothetical protein